jgi:hypothetical protein
MASRHRLGLECVLTSVCLSDLHEALRFATGASLYTVFCLGLPPQRHGPLDGGHPRLCT